MARPGEVNKMHNPLRTVDSQSTRLPELLRSGKGTECIAYLGLFPCRASENLSGMDLGTA